MKKIIPQMLDAFMVARVLRKGPQWPGQTQSRQQDALQVSTASSTIEATLRW